jgi:predicted DsbA family dithiol-disulfide isomerase
VTTSPDLSTPLTTRTVQVEIWSDIACPWCYLGKRRFAAALEAFPHREHVDVRWRSFELSPDTPAGPGTPLAPTLARRKGITPDQAAAMFAHVTAVAADEGLTFDFGRALAVNTFDGHRLVHLAGAHGGSALADRTLESLYAGYFTAGADLGDTDTLVQVAAEAGFAAAGLDDAAVRSLLAGTEAADQVQLDEADAAALGVSAVPFFAADRRVAVSGAQPVAVFTELLETAWRQANPMITLGEDGSGGACETDSCVV